MSVKVEKLVEPWFNGQLLGYNIKWSPSMMELYLLSVVVAFTTGYLVKAFHRAMFRSWLYVKTNLIPRFLVSFGETVMIGIGTFCSPFFICHQYSAQWWDAKLAEWAIEVQARAGEVPPGGSKPSSISSSGITPSPTAAAASKKD